MEVLSKLKDKQIKFLAGYLRKEN